DPPQQTRAKIDKVFGDSFPWYPVVGNHDLDSLPFLRSYFRKRLAETVNTGPDGTRETTYSFDAGEVHISVLDVSWNGHATPDSDRQRGEKVVPASRDWLAKDLAASKKTWKLVFAHEPAFPKPDQDWHDDRHVGQSLDKNPAERDALWSVLE